jgi:hypothetical protein
MAPICGLILVTAGMSRNASCDRAVIRPRVEGQILGSRPGGSTVTSVTRGSVSLPIEGIVQGERGID